MKAFLQLIRWPNLLIIIATQYLMRYAILDTMLKNIYVYVNSETVKVPDMELQLSNFQFLLLVMSTVFLTAAGYVINDYFDTKTDKLNRPQRVIVGKSISRRLTMTIHLVLNGLGVALGFYLAWSIGMMFLGFVFLLVSGLLWFYSTTYKRQFLIGNLLVAFLTGLVPFMVALFEIPLLMGEYSAIMIDFDINLNHILVWIGGFSFFAFITTLIRELVKDMEDFEGDHAYGRRSLPIVLGLNVSKIIVSSLILISLLALFVIVILYLNDPITLIYMIVALLLPMAFLTIWLWKANSSKAYYVASILTKVIMLSGLAYAVLAHFIIVYQLVNLG